MRGEVSDVTLYHICLKLYKLQACLVTNHDILVVDVVFPAQEGVITVNISIYSQEKLVMIFKKSKIFLI